MNEVTPKLTPIFSGKSLMGYALTVNGELIGRQLSCEIKTNGDEPARFIVAFGINDEMVTNTGRIDM